MEIEKPAGKIEAEKIAYDESGHSEKMTDVRLNQTASDANNAQQASKRSAVFQLSTKKENVILDTTTE